ncbi:abcF4 [Scenedesmus sp. PABB004]|nr:abcF4 [Scenedesmus sp. PABB004]
METLETTSRRDLALAAVQLSVGDAVLLSDATLALKAGVRYGLIGRNGVGKTTLLRVLGARSLIGFPRWLTCLHVEQEVQGSAEGSAIDAVLAADARAAALQRDVDALEAALDGGDEQELAAAVAALRAASAAAEASASNATAAARSGRRGVAARKAAVAAEAAASAAAGAAPLSGADVAAAAQELLAERYAQLAALEDADAAEGRARQILAGLGFSPERMAAPTATLSGGWRMRAALAAALFAAPDILCLDEPTNHLDLESIIWLQEYLSTGTEGQTLLLVSHDRNFLAAVTQETVELKDRQLRYFSGPYDAYVEAKAAAAVAAGRQASALERQRRHLQDSIAAAERQARQSGDDKKLLQAASRKKKLVERSGLDRSAAGHRFKLNRDLVGYFESRRPQVVLEAPDKPVELLLPQPEALRGGGPLLQLRGVGFTFPGAPAPALHGVTLDITPASRIALLGPNGAGKSTLLRLLAGQLEPTPPPPGYVPPAAPAAKAGAAGPAASKKQLKAARGLAVDAAALPSARAAAAAAAAGGAAGSVERAAALRVGLFGQHCVDELAVEETALARVMAAHPGLAREQDARDYLGGFGLGGRPATLPMRALSGGQKARAALALLLATRPHLLLLDEPTNHLDLLTVEALARAVASYEGAVVVASHDLRFVCDVAGGGGGGGEAGGRSSSGGGGASGGAGGEGGGGGEVFVVAAGRSGLQRLEGGAEGVAAYAARVRERVLRRQGALLRR